MYADLGPGLEVDLADDPPNGIDILYDHRYVADRMSRMRTMQVETQTSYNLYGYVSGNPGRYVDPEGLQQIPPNRSVPYDAGGGLQSSMTITAQYPISSPLPQPVAPSPQTDMSIWNWDLYKYYANPFKFFDFVHPDDWWLHWGKRGTQCVTGAAASGAIVVTGIQVGFLGGKPILEFTILRGGNVFKVVSRPFQVGFRVDPSHHGKPWGHTHWWKW